MDSENLSAIDIADALKDKAVAAELTISDETKHIAKLMCHNIDADIHNYFVAMIENASKKESGLTAEQLRNVAHDFAKILATINVIVNRHKNYIVHNDPDYDSKSVN